MNEWGFIGKDSLVVLAKPATINKFKSRRGYVRVERLVQSNPHSS
jgi:type IV secretory pathway protease TraF